MFTVKDRAEVRDRVLEMARQDPRIVARAVVGSTYWQAEYWISAARDYALSLACRQRGLSPFYGRGFDDLPEEVRGRFAGALPISIQRDALLAALQVAIENLVQEAKDLPRRATIELRLRQLGQARLS